MKTLPLSSITVPENRQRQTFPDAHIAELMESIFSPDVGLIYPLIVRDGGVLIAGECRLRAIKFGYNFGKTFTHAGEPVPLGEVPVIDLNDVPLLRRMELEYAENARRENLTWQENLRALEGLHELRKLQAEAVGLTHTERDTANEVQGGQATPAQVMDTRVDLKIAKALDDPDIRKAKSLTEARKIFDRKADAVRRENLAALTGKVSATEKYKAYHTDCVEWMKGQPDGQFDVILTDPPYGMGADGFGDAAGRMAGIDHEYRDDEDHAITLLSTCIPEFYRLAKPEAHLYLWCDIEHFLTLRALCRAAGWWTFRTPLINVKPEGGRVPWPEHGPRRAYEICLFGVKGKRPVVSIQPDVFSSRLSEGNLGHGAQKPVEAYVELLRRSVRPGDCVFDAFAGSGTIFPAAAAVQCHAVGTEQNAASFGLCIERIRGLN